MVGSKRWQLAGRGAFALGLVAVIYLSVAPPQSMPSVDIWDKAQHALAYLSLMLAGAIGFPQVRSHVVLAVGLVALGCLLEAVQLHLPMRVGSLGDAVANTVGVIVGLAGVRAVWPSLMRLK